jgi:A/G-specific adenine glycosylase
VSRVLDYYPRFLARYPTVEELAAAGADEVRDAWRGLGYYRRAENLRRTAQLVAERHGGRLPADPDTLVALPGIGRYTAGAVASFAFGADAAILDTNAARVLGRVFGPGRARSRTARLWSIAAIAIPRGRGYDFNQAIMDLGATVCTARQPVCPRCPVRPVCRTFGRSKAAGAAAALASRRPRRQM